MNTINTINTPVEQPFVSSVQKATDEVMQEQKTPPDSQWRRVLGVILIEGEMRYLVERGE